MGLPRWLSGEESACQCRRHGRCRFDLWVRKIPWRRKWQTTLVLLPEKSYGQRSLADYSPWGHKESDTNEQLRHNNIGIVLTNREDVEYGYVIEEADKAMYYAKERGKNTYHILKI